jgi:heme/copper-type cytochrome/quinol oxidase subunit 2
MADLELDDGMESLQAKETEHSVPVGITALFVALVAWGVYYVVAYLGWDQAADVNAGAPVATNIAHTVAYTAIPAAVIVVLAVAMSRRARSARSGQR